MAASQVTLSAGRERARYGRLLRAGGAGPVLIGYYEAGRHQTEWGRKHPFDQLHGVDTSGFVPGFLLGFTVKSGYVGAQPGIIRKALPAIPEPHQCHFLDLGCGKGRPLLVGTEFGFPAITGVEVSPGLARIARRNASILANAYPDRPRINIITADATKYRLPAESLVVFLYNPFDGPLIERLLGNNEAPLLQSPRTLCIVNYNPVFAGILDASPALERRYAAQIPYDPGELGYGPDTSDAVVILAKSRKPAPAPPGTARRRRHCRHPQFARRACRVATRLPRRDLPQTWVRPRKSKVVPPVFGGVRFGSVRANS